MASGRTYEDRELVKGAVWSDNLRLYLLATAVTVKCTEVNDESQLPAYATGLTMREIIAAAENNKKRYISVNKRNCTPMKRARSSPTEQILRWCDGGDRSATPGGWTKRKCRR